MCQVVRNWEANWGYVGGNWITQNGTKLNQVEAKLINFGNNLEPSWAKMGPSWAKLALSWANLEQRMAKLEPSRSQVGQDGRTWRTRRPSWTKLDQKRAKTDQMVLAEVCPGRLLGLGDLQGSDRIGPVIQHSCTPSGAQDLRRPWGESPAPPPSRMDLCGCFWDLCACTWACWSELSM